jgi:hypothetical protein
VLERLYRKIYVAIVYEANGHDVTIVGVKNKKLLFKERKHFEDPEPSTAFFTYIRKFIEQSPLYYIALLNPDTNQGAVQGCSLHGIDEDGDLSGAKTLCREQKWMLYASLRELGILKKRYAPVGLDFIFSPFSVIEHFFADKIGGDFALYALAQKDSFSVVFFENGKLEYAHHYPMNPSQMIEESSLLGFAIDPMHDEEDGIRLDDIEGMDDLDIIDEFDDLSDIEDLDALEEIAEFSDDAPTVEEKRTVKAGGKELKEQMDHFNDDYRRFELIQKTLAQFYAGEHCHDRFVETVYIADAYGSGADLKRYLEEELFLNVLIRKIDMGDEIIALSEIEEQGL